MLKNKIDLLLKENLRFPESTKLQQRGIADKIEFTCLDILRENCDNVSNPTSRRSIEDINIDNTYVDIKTSDMSLAFKMPNLISIDRLKKLDKELIYTFVIYDSENKNIKQVFSLSIYDLNWDHLAIQNLGKGQLQIKSMEKFLESPCGGVTKEQWIAVLKEKAIEFYKKVENDAKKRQQEWHNI